MGEYEINTVLIFEFKKKGEKQSGAWIDVSWFHSINCSCRGLQFNSQQTHEDVNSHL